ncbi:DUF1998 domain-containing protein [Nostoc sp. NIES-2111]
MSSSQKKFKAEGQIRRSQLLTTYGPGAMLDLPDLSVLVPGLEFWRGERQVIEEPRLAARAARLLNVPTLSLEAPPVSEKLTEEKLTGFQAFVFPNWFLTQDLETPDLLNPRPPSWRTRRLVHRKALRGGAFPDPSRSKNKLRNVVPIRFVQGCANGHLADIRWYDFVHASRNTTCEQNIEPLFYDERGTSSDLSEVYIRCGGCGAERTMLAATLFQSSPFGTCGGQQPWLGRGMRQNCTKPARLLIRGASNVYFAQNLSVISLPDRDNKLDQALDAVYADFFEDAESVGDVERDLRKRKPAEALAGYNASEVWNAILRRRNPQANAADKEVKVAELETLLKVPGSLDPNIDLAEERPEGVFSARALPKPLWDRAHTAGIARVILVSRLREVSALLGFTRLEAYSPDALGEYDIDVQRAPIADPLTWLPARENRGEGIFLQFDSDALAAWKQKPGVRKRLEQAKNAFASWSREHSTSKRKFPGAEYLLLHSFSHLLLTAISLECGYPASSIRERIYAVPGTGFGLLLFTAASDSEGTLGGLIEAGKRIESLVRRALLMGQLCSNDPVCSEHDFVNQAAHRYLHGAACHGCLLISETCCEMQNDFLDRALVVHTLNTNGAEENAAFFLGIQS